MANNKTAAKKASDILAKATLKIADFDPALSERLTKALAAEMARYQRGE